MVCLTLAALGILAAVQFSLAQRGAGKCQWAALRMQTDIYIESQTSGEVDPLLTSSSPVYRENYKQRDINTSFLTTPLKIDYTRTFVDQRDCKTYSQLIVANPKNPYIIGTQITYDNTGSAGLKAKIIDVVISRPSTEPQFNATKTLAYVDAEDWSVIVTAKQDSRDLLKMVANSYLDLWSGNGNFELPWGTPCARLEGSEYYTEECQPVSLNGKANTDRRYVVDEGLGAVSVFSKGGSDGTLLDIHEFRLVQGKLRYVHHFTASDAASVV
ncbi:hypothetical protein B0H65DRAFT_79611 [Neurospora tetraspora]|uniref:DUF8021 domain-containing protein n=1 Tax=Neurospora tetraspora TaxID=94610 RepID=A0AAE0IZS2_9PEZI|nr:hypothetical protein B0H65DRAFT_79611 [Neurospora tetraspora]